MTLPHDLAVKLAKPIRLLASDSKGEAFAALCAIARLLQAYQQSFHTLAEHVENGGGLSEADKQRISAAIESARIEGYAEGVKAAVLSVVLRVPGCAEATALHSRSSAAFAHALALVGLASAISQAGAGAACLGPPGAQRYSPPLALLLGGKQT